MEVGSRQRGRLLLPARIDGHQHPVVTLLAEEHVQHRAVVVGRRPQSPVAGRAQRRVLVAERDERLERAPQLLVPAGLFPGEGAAVVRVVAARHADLVAVVDAGSTREGEHQQRRQHHRLPVAAGERRQARGVVGGEQVQVGAVGVLRVHVQQALDVVAVGRCVHRRVHRIAHGLGQPGPDQLPGGEADVETGQDVVHRAVETVARGDPVGRVVPQLAHQVEVRVDLAGALPELLPEAGRDDLAGHVEPPAVDALARPVFPHLHQVLADVRVVGVELRQRRDAPPGVVVGRGVVVRVQRPALDVEPVDPGRFRTVLQQVAELEEPPAGVVEDPVQHHPHAPLVAVVEKTPEGALASEDRVHAVVVVGVVAMVGGRLEDGIEVQRGDPEVAEVVEPLGDAHQVATLEAVAGGGSVPRLQAVRLAHLLGPGEAVREDLIEDGVSHPGRGTVERRGHRPERSPPGRVRPAAGPEGALTP